MIFQIPGSQDKSITLQVVSQPQSKLFNSFDLVGVFWANISEFSSSFWSYFLPILKSLTYFCSLNSTKVFHSLQKPHCQAHFMLSFQQLLQTNIFILISNYYIFIVWNIFENQNKNDFFAIN